MAALWRRTPLALTRSTPCFGSASSPPTILIVAINVALLYVVRRYRAERGAEPRQLARRPPPPVPGRRRPHHLRRRCSSSSASSSPTTPGKRPRTGDAGLASPKAEPLKIKATGQQWLWRYDYPNGAFSYYKLVVPADTAVELELLSTDVVHTWNVPELAAQGRRRPRQDQPRPLPRRRGGHPTRATPRPSPARPTPRCGPRSRSSRPRTTKTSSKQQKEDIEAAQDRVVGLIENGETP